MTSVEDLIVIRQDSNVWAVKGVEDLPMTKYQLVQFLGKLQNIRAEEIAFMFQAFDDDERKREAHFGVNGFFLFSR